jgi:AraC-like DNA-binding protein
MMICLFWGIFFTVRCWASGKELRIPVTMVLFYTAATILYFDHWLYFSGIRDSLAAWSYITANLSVYPLYYAYLRALTRSKRTVEEAVLLTPALLVSIFYPVNQHFGWLSEHTLFLMVRICFAILVIWVWLRGWHLIRATQRRMDNTYSDNRSFLLRPTHMLLVFIGATAVVSMVLNLIGRDFFVQETNVTAPAVIMSLLLYGLGYVAAHTTLPQETVAPMEEDAEDKATTEETDELMHKIATAMREQKLFADPKLTIQDVASAMNSNRTYISNCINRYTGLNFSQYVARYRVEHAQEILRDKRYASDHDALADAIALSGFSSDQNFYRVFKDATGLTPLQYRKSKI